jgi:RNA polymerase sigma-70 factor (ECF subfamily)
VFAREERVATFENIFLRWRDPVYAYVLRMVANRELAGDISQEVFLRVLKAAPGYNHRGRLRQWLFTIAFNLVADHVRRTRRRREICLDGVEAAGNVNRPFPFQSCARTDSEISERVRLALQELPPEQRSVLLMRQYAGLTFKEIAAIENCPINTALGRMRYALRNLRRILEPVSKEM